MSTNLTAKYKALREWATVRCGRLWHDDPDPFDAELTSVEKRYGICCEKEKNRRAKSWMREPGVLDDWNDTRSILDL